MLRKNKYIYIIFILDIFMIITSYFAVSYLDIVTTDYLWIKYINENGLFHAYESWNLEYPIDYPPLYVIWLYLIRNFIGGPYSNQTQIIMKLLPLLSQFAAQIFIYRKISPEAALKWSINLSFIINIVIYGQRDVLFGLLVVLLFYAMKENKWFSPGIITAIMCLLKPQGCYFVFILMFYFIVKRLSLSKIVISLCSAIVLGLTVFTPFAIASNDAFISIRLYLYAMNRHHVFAKCAGNIFGFFEFISVPEWFERVSFLLILACMFICVFIYKKTKDFNYAVVIYMFFIFMFTSSQHGRYAMYSMIIMFILVYMYNFKEYLFTYKMLIASTFLAQIGMLFCTNYSVFSVLRLGVDLNELPKDVVQMVQMVRIGTIFITFILNLIVLIRLILMKFETNESVVLNEKTYIRRSNE